MGGQLSITAAYTAAPAKEISVFDYSQILFAALLGIFFLGQYPDLPSLLGLCSDDLGCGLEMEIRAQASRRLK